MKLLAVATLAIFSTLALSNSEFVSKKEASQLLDDVEGRYKRAAQGLWGKSLDKQLKKLGKKWKNYCDFNSMEKWNEFKDELEETSLPEKEVDRLESCTELNKKMDLPSVFSSIYYYHSIARKIFS